MFEGLDLQNTSLSNIDGRLFTLNDSHLSELVLSVSIDADAAWDDLSAESREMIMVSGEALRIAGYDPRKYFRAPETWGFGNDAFPVQIDVFHQIHCLDVLRKQAHAVHYDLDGNTDWKHVGHCLGILLQNIMCTADVTLIPHRWVENRSRPFAQFSVQKQCRAFGQLKEWNTIHAAKITADMFKGAKRGEDAFVWRGYGEAVSDGALQ